MRYPRRSKGARSCRFIKQRLRLLQVRRIETFGEPIVDRTEQITAFARLPWSRQSRASSHIEEFRILTACDVDSLEKTSFSRRPITDQ